MAVTSDYIFTAGKSGVIEVWLKETLRSLASIKMGGGGGRGKIASLASDTNGESLFTGSTDGKIQVCTEQSII